MDSEIKNEDGIIEEGKTEQNVETSEQHKIDCEKIASMETTEHVVPSTNAVVTCEQLPIQESAKQITEESVKLPAISVDLIENSEKPINEYETSTILEAAQLDTEIVPNHNELINFDASQPTQSEITAVAVERTADSQHDSNIEIVSDVILTKAALLTSSEINKNDVEMDGGALGLLAQYDSDISDSESNCQNKTICSLQSPKQEESNIESVQVLTTNTIDYRAQNDTDSNSDSNDSSDSSTSDSSDDQTEGRRTLHRLRKKIEKSIAVSDEEDDDDDDDDVDGLQKAKKHRQPLKVKGELLLVDLPPIEDLHITVPEEECIEFGQVHSIVDQLLLVSVLPNSLLLDLETVLFLDKGQRVLGEVFDVLGQVSAPLYCVRFNSNVHIQEKQINIGDKVYVAPKTEYTQYIILSSLMKMRGSDASWENDIEPPPRFLDYSDDEQERLARARLRNKDRQEPAGHDAAQKRTYSAMSTSAEINQDNDDNMSVASCSTINSDSSNRAHWRAGRGRGRGHARARGRGQAHAYNAHNYPPPPINTGSWHSHYYGVPVYNAGPAPYYNYAQNFAAMQAPFMPPYGPPPAPHAAYWTSQPPPPPPPSSQPPNN